MKATTSPFRSNFYLWNGVSAIFFSNCVTNVHSHNTMQILVDIHDQFKCRIGDSPWRTCKNLIIKEDTPHQLDTNNSVQLIIYLDVETSAAKAIKARYPGDAIQPDFDLFGIIPPNQLQQVLLKPDAQSLLVIVSSILQTLAGQTTPTQSDPRIRIIEKTIDTGRPDDLSTTALAAEVHLSESRLRALFKEHTGVSLHKYILWSRIRYAINKIMTGSPINDAAWEAGFTDNSHFHKILVGMFGISPSQFLRDNKTMEIFTCGFSPLNFETKVYDANGQVEKIYK
ncbi:MAG TPA: AraC family transcriptional regulator [Puia sp.]|uniref:AraC family transcriptional regulator n=1 Tax=Puia sp. TaxID=2045100 RepID=UPI002C66257F|nr:AraC family transcriptional regulator [Puia sp.]HVU95219.1 AraC family transcriptional regulator [Puia sp.]